MYITTHTSTVFPLIATRPVDYKFRHFANRTPDATIVAPLYTTESAVTRAIADGTFQGFANEAYAAAKRYQSALKASKRRIN